MKSLAIRTAEATRKLTEDSLTAYAAEVTAGAKMRAVMREIEDAAIDMQRSVEIVIKGDADEVDKGLIAEQLVKGGFIVDFVTHERKFLGVPYQVKVLQISW